LQEERVQLENEKREIVKALKRKARDWRMKTVLISIGVIVSLILSSLAFYTAITPKAILETPEVEITGVAEYSQNATVSIDDYAPYNLTIYVLNASISVNIDALYKTFIFYFNGVNVTIPHQYEQIYQNTTVVSIQETVIPPTSTPQPNLSRITSISVYESYGQDYSGTLISIWKNPNYQPL
jgi:hypothetical protein